jgi:hypothetical protein
MSEPDYQFRDYPRAIAERAWRRLAGNHQWICLDRFTAILSKTTNDEALSHDLVKAAVCSQFFCGPSGRRLILFLPKPSPYSRRSEAWRVTAAEYADSTKRFARIGLLDWYLQSVWAPVRLFESWCSKKGYPVHLPDSIVETPDVPSKRAVTPKELQGKRGPRDKHPWDVIKTTVFSLMDSRGEFCPARGWYQQKLIDRALDELGLDNPPDISGFKRHLARWLPEWRAARK